MSQTASPESANIPAGLESLVLKASVSDRRKIVRHYELCEAEGDRGHADKWRRLANMLSELAPKAINTIGTLSLRFYRADGKYRKQLFALEDLRNGKILIYADNVLAKAVSSKLLTHAKQDDPARFIITGTDKTLYVESLATTNTDPPLYKDMLGWNRTAIRITLPTTATEGQMVATEKLCKLAAGPVPVATE